MDIEAARIACHHPSADDAVLARLQGAALTCEFQPWADLVIAAVDRCYAARKEYARWLSRLSGPEFRRLFPAARSKAALVRSEQRSAEPGENEIYTNRRWLRSWYESIRGSQLDAAFGWPNPAQWSEDGSDHA